MGVSHVLAHIAVPIFFLISSYLFFVGLETWSTVKWKRKIYSRINTLLIPYLVWISLYVLLTRTIPTIEDYWCSVHWNIERVDLWGNPNIDTGPLLVPMWFIRDLISCICLSPLFYLLLRHSNDRYCNYRVSSSIVLISVLYFTQTAIPIPGLNGFSIFFFAIGSVLSLNGVEIENILTNKMVKCLTYICAILLFIVELIYDGHNTNIGSTVYPIYVLAGVFTVTTMVSDLLKKCEKSNSRVNKVLIGIEKQADATFFIFASHPILLQYVNPLLHRIIYLSGISQLGDFEVVSTIEYSLRIIVTTVICIISFRILHRYTPHLSKILCGK